MRRANGSGSVYKLSGKRRKPWIARVTTGWSDAGKQQYKNIGTYATKKEAQAALETYFYIPEAATEMTFKEAYESWRDQGNVKEATLQAYNAAFKKLTRIYDLNMSDFTLDIMQEAVDTPPVTYATASAVKKVLSASISYAYSHDCCPASRKELLTFVKLPERVPVQNRRPFTDDEIQACIDQKAWGAVCLLFTGLRIDEFLSLKMEDIHLDEGWIHVSKSKTKAGIRDVPLPDRLIPIFRKWMESDLFRKSADVFSYHWKSYPVLRNHVRHECRHTYITKLKTAGVDLTLISKLVGHSGTVTETVYTHYTIDQLRGVVNEVFEKYLPISLDDEAGPIYRLAA